ITGVSDAHSFPAVGGPPHLNGARSPDRHKSPTGTYSDYRSFRAPIDHMRESLLCVYLPDACSTIFASGRQEFSVGTEINGRYFVFMADASAFSTVSGILVHLPYPGGVVIAGRGNLVTTCVDRDVPYSS